MPNIAFNELEKLAGNIFQSIGVPEEGASLIAEFLVRANLRGHDSHGVIRIPQYIDCWKRGEADPKAVPTIAQEGPATAMVDGHFGFGQIIAKFAMELAMEKAAASGVSAVGLFNCNHVGRLADYTEMALKRDMIGIMTVNAGGAAQRMAPWGGKSPRLATNPIAFACPTEKREPINVDFATTIVAEGKVRLRRNRKEQTPEGWILDSEGRPTTDPNKIYDAPIGSILPAGAHKGYCLSLMVELLSGVLTGAGYVTEKPGQIQNGGFMIVLDIARFVPPGQFRADADDMIRYLKNTPPIAGVEEVLTPGEPEKKTEADRKKNGIFVEDETWGQIAAIGREFNVNIPDV